MTLDNDVLTKLKQESRARGVPFRQALNDMLRSGMNAPLPVTPPPFRVEPRKMGTRTGLSYDSVAELLELGEGDWHR